MAKNRKRKSKVIKMTQKLSPEKYIKKVARKLPIKETFFSDSIFTLGLGQVFVVREKKNGDLIVGAYMVDIFACGVKDSFFSIIDEDELEKLKYSATEKDPDFKLRDPNYTFNLIYGAVEYAEDLGIAPHKSFALTSYILDDVEEIEYIDIEFGKDGRPFYMPSMNENPDRIISILNKSIGIGNYDFFIDIEPNESLEKMYHVNDLIENMSESDRAKYYYYSVVANETFDYVNGNTSVLEEEFNNNPDALHKNIKNCIANSKKYAVKDILSVYDDFKDINFSLIESIILEGNVDFIEDEIFINTLTGMDDMD